MRAARSSDLLGEVVAGYETIRVIGRGGVGRVYLAKRKADGVHVALKVLHRGGVAEAFARETQIAMQLSHPNIARVLDRGENANGAWAALEYCPEGDLRQLIQRRGGKLEISEARLFIRQAINALEYAHETDVMVNGKRMQGVVHCDLKPANLLLFSNKNAEPGIKLADFGSAHAIGSPAQGGTVAFMAREQLDGVAVRATDVWGLAATLFFMLSGTTPREFDGKDPLAVVRHEPARPFASLCPEHPSEFAAVIDRALNDDLQERYPSCRAFGNALKNSLKEREMVNVSRDRDSSAPKKR